MHEHFRGFTVRQYSRNVHVYAVDPYSYYLILLATFYPFIFANLDFDMPFFYKYENQNIDIFFLPLKLTCMIQ